MNTIRQAKTFYIVCSVLLCLLGVFLIVRPDTSVQVLCYIMGAVSLLYGIEKIIGYFSNDMYHLAFQFDLALGVFVALLGIVLILHPGKVATWVAFLVGLFVLVDGVFKIQTAVDACRFGLSKWWLILAGGLLCVAIGVFLLFDPFSGSSVLIVFVGVSLLIDGLQNLFNALYTVRVIQDAKQSSPVYVEDEDQYREEK